MSVHLVERDRRRSVQVGTEGNLIPPIAYKLFTKSAQSSGAEKMRPQRPLPGLRAKGPVLSPSRITLENKGKIRPQPDRENAFAESSGGSSGTGAERSPTPKLLLSFKRRMVRASVRLRRDWQRTRPRTLRILPVAASDGTTRNCPPQRQHLEHDPCEIDADDASLSDGCPLCQLVLWHRKPGASRRCQGEGDPPHLHLIVHSYRSCRALIRAQLSPIGIVGLFETMPPSQTLFRKIVRNPVTSGSISLR
jgi:hypothetical protein